MARHTHATPAATTTATAVTTTTRPLAATAAATTTTTTAATTAAKAKAEATAAATAPRRIKEKKRGRKEKKKREEEKRRTEEKKGEKKKREEEAGEEGEDGEEDQGVRKSQAFYEAVSSPKSPLQDVFGRQPPFFANPIFRKAWRCFSMFSKDIVVPQKEVLLWGWIAEETNVSAVWVRVFNHIFDFPEDTDVLRGGLYYHAPTFHPYAAR